MKQFALVYFFIGIIFQAFSAKDHLDSLNNELGKRQGIEKLKVYHKLIEGYLKENPKKALRFAKQAQAYNDELIDIEKKDVPSMYHYLSPLTYNYLGKAYYKQKEFNDSKNAFEKALSMSTAIKYSKGIQQSQFYLHKIKRQVPVEKKKEKDKIQSAIGQKINSSSHELVVKANLKLASMYENSGNYNKAIKQYDKATDRLLERGKDSSYLEVMEMKALAYEKAANFQKAIEIYKHIDSMRVEKKIEIRGASSQSKIENLKQEFLDLINANSENSTAKIELKKSENDKDVIKTQSLKQKAVRLEENQDFEQSLIYYKEYMALQEKINERESKQELALLEKSHQIERKAREIELLKQEKEIQALEVVKGELELSKQASLRNRLIIGALLLLGLVITLYFSYRNKKKSHVNLQTAYNELDMAQQKLSDAEKRIKTLLHQQVSAAVADELISGKSSIDKVEKRFVCILFLDIRDFTPFAEKRTPEEIIQYQNDVFGFMIDIIQEHHGIINQFLGDGFMATFGAPVSSGNDCDNAVAAAQKMIETVQRKSQERSIPQTRVGIGLHAGEVVAGNVGTEHRKQYSITGNTVILASRIEQLNKQFNSNLLISGEVYDQLTHKSDLPSHFEEVHVKGRKETIRVLKLA